METLPEAVEDGVDAGVRERHLLRQPHGTAGEEVEGGFRGEAFHGRHARLAEVRLPVSTQDLRHLTWEGVRDLGLQVSAAQDHPRRQVPQDVGQLL